MLNDEVKEKEVKPTTNGGGGLFSLQATKQALHQTITHKNILSGQVENTGRKKKKKK